MAKSKLGKVNISKLEIKTITQKVQKIENIPDLINSNNTKVNYSIQLNPLYSLASNIIKIELSVNLDLEHKNIKHVNVGEFSFDFFYQYSDLSDISDSDGIINPEIFLICSNISYSTLRGIIYAKSANTCLENALLPIVTGSELMAGNQTIPSN